MSRIKFLCYVIIASLCFGADLLAQEINPQLPSATTMTVPIQEDMVPETPGEESQQQRVYEPQKFAVLQTLDKVTARTATVTVAVGQASAVGPLFLDVKTCQKTPPTEQPEAAAFLQIWEAKPKRKTKKKNIISSQAEDDVPSQWVFSGWMFASSPALSAMNHPIYDVWLKDCINSKATSAVK